MIYIDGKIIQVDVKSCYAGVDINRYAYLIDEVLQKNIDFETINRLSSGKLKSAKGFCLKAEARLNADFSESPCYKIYHPEIPGVELNYRGLRTGYNELVFERVSYVVSFEIEDRSTKIVQLPTRKYVEVFEYKLDDKSFRYLGVRPSKEKKLAFLIREILDENPISFYG